MISAEKSRNHIFRLTGPGADQDPKGLFTIDMETGDVSVSRSLDREAIESYQVGVCLWAGCLFLLFCFQCLFAHFYPPLRNLRDDKRLLAKNFHSCQKLRMTISASDSCSLQNSFLKKKLRMHKLLKAIQQGVQSNLAVREKALNV